MAAMVMAVVCAFVVPASAQPKKKPEKAEPAAGAAGASKDDGKGGGKKDAKNTVKNFDFNDFNLAGKMRTPQLLYFLERANEELERSSLEKRSFIPHMVRTVEEEAL
jgi:hypothetical protein